jgi:hypothetical protein
MERQAYPSDLTDEQWAYQLQSLCPSDTEPTNGKPLLSASSVYRRQLY